MEHPVYLLDVKKGKRVFANRFNWNQWIEPELIFRKNIAFGFHLAFPLNGRLQRKW